MNLKWAENSSKNLLSPVSLYCCIVIFFLYKLTDLFVPYFWDELGVYAKASLYMYDNHVTLLPGVIPDELSRGHPLLCAALFGTFYKLLGPSVWAGHLTALMLSCTLILVLYLWGRKMYGQQIAAIACLLLMVQPVFIAQSSMVLPEILLALICFAAIFFYINNRLALFALFSSLAILRNCDRWSQFVYWNILIFSKQQEHSNN